METGKRDITVERTRVTSQKINIPLIQRILFQPNITEEEYQRRRAVMTRLDGWRFRRCARFLTCLARKMEDTNRPNLESDKTMDRR